jgi:hypothetical protein
MDALHEPVFTFSTKDDLDSLAGLELGPIERGVPLPSRKKTQLTPEQERVLLLKDGESFTIRTISADEDSTGNRSHASHVAARLSVWARGRHVQLSYRLIDKITDTVRVMRVGTLRSHLRGGVSL